MAKFLDEDGLAYMWSIIKTKLLDVVKSEALLTQFPVGSVYTTYENINPSTFMGGTWELIGGVDSKNYYPAFATDTDVAGTTVEESLPNITGSIQSSGDRGGTYIDPKGAFTAFGNATYFPSGSKSNTNLGVIFDASNSCPTYQDGAQVNVKALKLFFWRRTG